MRVLALVFSALVLAAAWLVMTESGLSAVAAIAEHATGKRLELNGARGRLLDEIGFDTVVFSDPAATVEIDTLRLQLDWKRLFSTHLYARSLSAANVKVTTHPQPEPETHQPLTLEAPIQITLERGEIGSFDLWLADGETKWGLSNARIWGAWKGKWFTLEDFSADTTEAGTVSLSGRIGISEDHLRLRKVHVEGPASIDLAGEVALTDAGRNVLKASWRRLRWPGVDTFDSKAGNATLEGPWSNYAWTLEASLNAAGIATVNDGRGRGSLQRIDIHRMNIEALDGTIRGSGKLDWSSGLVADVEAKFEKLNPGRVDAKWPGTINGEARFAGHWRSEVPELDFEAQLINSKLRDYPLALKVMGNTQNRKVVLHKLSITSGASVLNASGRVMPDFDLSGGLQSSDLRSLWVGLSGSTDLRARLTGTPEAPRLSVDGSAGELTYKVSSDNWLSAAAVQISATLAPQSRSTFTLDLDQPNLGVPLKRLTVNGQGTEGSHRIQLETDGTLGRAKLDLDGGLRADTWRGKLRNLKLWEAGEPFGGSWSQEEDAAVRVSAAGFSMEAMCLANGGERVCAHADTSASRQSFAARLKQLELRHLRHWLPHDWTLTGSVDGTASVRIHDGELEDLRADLSGSPGHLEGGGVNMDFGPGTLNIQPEDRRLRASLRLTPAGGEIRGDLWLAPGGALLDRQLTGQLQAGLPNLSWLPVISSEVAAASGSLHADLDLAGTARSPSVKGDIIVNDGRVLLTTPGIELTGIKARFVSSDVAVLGVSVEADSGGGTLQLEGGLDQLRPEVTGRFRLTGQDAQWANTPDIRAWVTPNLELVLAGPESKLTGEILVPKARITPRQLASSGVSPSSDQVIVDSTVPPPGKNGLRLTSEVRIVLGKDVRINGLGLKTRLEGAIDASDRPGRSTRGRGELRTVGGRYKAYGQDLTIETGRLLFNGGPVSEPGIDLSAYRDTRDPERPGENLRVGLRARGTLAAPKFTLYSNRPGLSQEQQLSWLVLGRPLNETLQTGQRTELDTAATSLGFAGSEYLGNRLLAPKVGLDEFSVGTRPGESNEQARLTVGKYLSPKLFVSYGFALFKPERFLRLQYDLGRGFKLSGESGSDQSGDLIYSFER